MSTETAAEQDSVGRWLEKVEGALPHIDLEVEAAVQRIHKLTKHIEKRMKETLAEFDIGHGEWSLLGALSLSGPPYRSSPGQLAQKEGLSSGAMTNRLDQLEKAGLVRRLPDPDDRRALQVELTDKGHELWKESVGAQAAREASLTAALDKKELEQLNKLLRKALRGLEESA